MIVTYRQPTISVKTSASWYLLFSIVTRLPHCLHLEGTLMVAVVASAWVVFIHHQFTWRYATAPKLTDLFTTKITAWLSRDLLNVRVAQLFALKFSPFVVHALLFCSTSDEWRHCRHSNRLTSLLSRRERRWYVVFFSCRTMLNDWLRAIDISFTIHVLTHMTVKNPFKLPWKIFCVSIGVRTLSRVGWKGGKKLCLEIPCSVVSLKNPEPRIR